MPVKMNREKLMKMAGAAGRAAKKKAVHKTTKTDDKRLQSTLKRIGVNTIPAIEEVKFSRMMWLFIQASIPANAWVVSGSPQTKRPDNLDNLRELAEQFQKQGPPTATTDAAAADAPEDDDDDGPELVAGETFEAAAEEEGHGHTS
ncbi:Basic transcription factor 3-like protein [Drosera capensis]